MGSRTQQPIRVGISGWTYAPWRGAFYPEGLRRSDELHFASRQFSTIEINGSFYSLQSPSSYAAWYQATPQGFVFSVKGGRYVTHIKRLHDARPALANFFASGIFALREKLGPILWQLPPTFRFEIDRLRAFFELLPRSTAEMEKLAKSHDSFLLGRSLVEAQHDAEPTYAVEVRHPSFLDARYVELLQEFSIASCIADSAGHFPTIENLTGPLVYVRLHGSQELYTSGYTPDELQYWCGRVLNWQRGRDAAEPRTIAVSTPRCSHQARPVFVYFDNDAKVHAPFDAREFAERLRALGGPAITPSAQSQRRTVETGSRTRPKHASPRRSP